MHERRYRQAEGALWTSVGVQPTERQLDLERTGCRVRVQEVGEGPPVLFVHGVSNCGASWAPLVARLDGWRRIVLDRPGCGLSPRLDRRLTDMEQFGAFADDLLVDVLDALGLDEAHLVGTSFGGYFTLRSAAAHPDRFGRLVEVGWTFGAPIARTPLAMRVATLPFLGRLATRIPANERMARQVLQQVGLQRALESGRFGDTEMRWFLSVLRDTDTMRNEIDAAPRIITLRGFNDETLLTDASLARVRCPASFVWGGEDPMGGEAIARSFVARLPDAALELLPEAGHAPWFDDPDRVAELVGRFLRR